MNKKAIFIAGFILGTVLTHWRNKKRAKRNESFEEINKTLDNCTEEVETIIEKMKKTNDELDARKSEIMDEAIKIMNEQGYIKTTKPDFNKIYPYQISAEEFAEYDEYEALSLTYFADGVLTDEDHEIIQNPKELVGDFVRYFGDKDVIYIRCDERCADYEIAKDIRTYAEFYNTIPHVKWRHDE